MNTKKILCISIFLLILTFWLNTSSYTENSLGIGSQEVMVPSTGTLGQITTWVNNYQKEFYRSLGHSLKTMKESGSGLWILVLFSFAYGVFHALGPGHGKFVISSYMLANETVLRRGIILSFASALFQGLTAIIITSIAFLVLHHTPISMTDATRFLEICSYVILLGFGMWLLSTKIYSAFFTFRRRNFSHKKELKASFVEKEACCHAFLPDPKSLSGKNFNLKKAAFTVIAIGLRPCSGALLVLTFSFFNGLWIAGILSVFVMAIGVALTISSLAIIAVQAKNWAIKKSNGSAIGSVLYSAIEIVGALLIMLLGLTLLTASLSS